MKNKYSLIILVICSFAFNLLISDHYIHKDLTPDETLYNSMAVSLLDGKNYFLAENKQIDIGQEVTPFYSMLVAGIYSIMWKIPGLIIFNLILSCITVILLFLIIRNITGNTITGFGAALIFTLYYPLWAYNFFIMMEIPTVFLLTLAVGFLVRFFRIARFGSLFAAIATLSFLVLINNRFFVLLIILIIALFFIALRNKNMHFRYLIIISVIPLVIIGPWFLRQYIVYDQFVFFTPKWNNLVAEKVGIFKPVNFVSIEDMSDSYKLMSYDYYRENIEKEGYGSTGDERLFTKEKFCKAVRERNRIGNIYLARIVRYFNLFDNDFRFLYPDSYRLAVPSSLPYKLVQTGILLPMFVFSFPGILFSFRKRELVIISLALLWFSHIFLHVIIHYIDRYRLTILPVVLILASYGFTQIRLFLNANKRMV